MAIHLEGLDQVHLPSLASAGPPAASCGLLVQTRAPWVAMGLYGLWKGSRVVTFEAGQKMFY